VKGRTAEVERRIDRRRNYHPSQSGRQRERGVACVRENSFGNLPLDFETDDQEEQGHGEFVDPEVQVLGEDRVPESNGEGGMP